MLSQSWLPVLPAALLKRQWARVLAPVAGGHCRWRPSGGIRKNKQALPLLPEGWLAGLAVWEIMTLMLRVKWESSGGGLLALLPTAFLSSVASENAHNYWSTGILVCWGYDENIHLSILICDIIHVRCLAWNLACRRYVFFLALSHTQYCREHVLRAMFVFSICLLLSSHITHSHCRTSHTLRISYAIINTFFFVIQKLHWNLIPWFNN